MTDSEDALTAPEAGSRRLEKVSVAAQAAEAIKDMIVSGELQPGEALPAERQLAQLLDISRPTLRQAIGSLSAMNIIESRHGGGTFVTELTPELLTEPIQFLLRIDDSALASLFEVRQVLEVSAAGLAASRIGDQHLARIRGALDAGTSTLADVEAFVAADVAFHAAIVDALENPIYSALYASISTLSAQTRAVTAQVTAVRRRAHRDHVAIAAALAARDPDAAAEAMREHLDAMRSAYDRAARRPRPRPADRGD